MRFAINRSWLLLGVALLLGLASAFGVKRYIEQRVEDIDARDRHKKTVAVVVPLEDLAKGALLSSQNVAVREVPADFAHSNAIKPDEFSRVEGQALAYPVAQGEMLLWSLMEGQRSATFSARVPAGRRAITVPVDEINSISGMLQPGDHIDLVVTAKRDNKIFMFPLLQNVTVMATGAQAIPIGNWDGKEGSRRSYNTVTLDASPEEARRVLAAREVGKLAALLRAPGDTAPAMANREDAMSLLGLADAKSLRSAADGDSGVPVIYGGRGEIKSAPRLQPKPAGEDLDPLQGAKH
ncbi:MAG TPA: Flp pilus assembly protein CpaB [Burkholderiaceae bacterium]|nr:Flp pilus assembly protein CpaB [Burkholderiaceae bacterium]